MRFPYQILDRKRRGERLSRDEIEAVVRGAADGGWDDAQLGAFLMAAAIRGLDRRETADLTRAMLRSGASWRLAEEIPGLGDKHSTGGVGDKVSLVLAPLLAASGLPVAMLTGRGLGHTGGTADKLEAIPGLRLDLDRAEMLRVVESSGMAIGVATAEIAPADRTLYALRDVTGTVASVPLIVASILSKKLAMGASGMVFDVKTGNGAFLEQPAEAEALAARLVEVGAELGQRSAALVTDMSQPLGRWAGHGCEVGEALECLGGGGPADLRRLAVELAVALGDLLGADISRRALDEVLSGGEARERFLAWAGEQGAESDWVKRPRVELAPVEVVALGDVAGWLTRVDTRGLGLLLAEMGGGRRRRGEAIDRAVALSCECRLGDRLEVGQPLARLYVRQRFPDLAARLASCFEITEESADPPPLIRSRVGTRPS